MDIDSELQSRLQELQERLQLDFPDPELIRRSLTHPSYLGEGEPDRTASNQRLEFLGDSVLGLIVAEHLYLRHESLSEGDLTKMKAVAVSESILVDAARSLSLGDFLLLGKGEESSGGRMRNSILADALEALIGAIYLQHGLETTRELVLRIMGESLSAIEERRHIPDYKSLLQETIQSQGMGTPTYHVVETSGPDHDKRFSVEVRIRHQAIGRGHGSSKKEAEQSAAAEALAAHHPESLPETNGPARRRGDAMSAAGCKT